MFKNLLSKINGFQLHIQSSSFDVIERLPFNYNTLKEDLYKDILVCFLAISKSSLSGRCPYLRRAQVKIKTMCNLVQKVCLISKTAAKAGKWSGPFMCNVLLLKKLFNTYSYDGTT